MNFYKNLYNFLIYENNPSEYLVFLKNKGFISNIPELQYLIGTPQDPIWHPEGDVWQHTLMVIDNAAVFRDEFYYQDDFAALMLGALCHDLGKPYTTYWDRGKWRSPKHDLIGLIPTTSLLNKIGVDDNISKKVLSYVLEHLHPMQLYKAKDNLSKQAIIKLNERISIPDLILLSIADHFGRTTEDAINKEAPHCQWLVSKYIEIIKEG